MAHPAVLTPRARAAALSAVVTAALVVLALVPLGEARVALAVPTGLLVVVACLGALGLSLAAAGAALRTPGRGGTLVHGAALWSAAGQALCATAAATAATAQTLDLTNLVRAQVQTGLYLLRQPAAAAIFVVAFVLAADESVLRALLGPVGAVRRVCESLLALAVAAVAATLYLGGYAGPRLPGPVWLALKCAAVVLLLFALRRRFTGLAPGARLAVTWFAAVVALLNLMVTLIVVTR